MDYWIIYEPIKGLNGHTEKCFKDGGWEWH